MRYGARVSTTTRQALVEAVRLLTEVQTSQDGRDTVSRLARARELVDSALNEAMASAVVQGVSVRQVADAAGLAPNTVPPRLARTVVLGRYAEGGAVTGQGIARARHDSGRVLRFTGRRPDSLR